MDEKKKTNRELALHRRNAPSLWPYDFVSRFFDDNWTNNIPTVSGFKVDVRENKDNYIIEAEMPGLEKQNIQLDLDDDLLTISARKEESKEEKDDEGRYIRREIRSGSFQRSFVLDNVDVEKIDAAMKNGVLKIKCPKKENVSSKAKKIEIK